jgi:hypothetical protein
VSGGSVRDDRDDRRVPLAQGRAARRGAAHLDLRIRGFSPEPLHDHDVAAAKAIFTFQEDG